MSDGRFLELLKKISEASKASCVAGSVEIVAGKKILCTGGSWNERSSSLFTLGENENESKKSTSGAAGRLTIQ